MCVAQSALACYLLGRYEDAITLGEQAVLLGSEQVAFGDLYFYMGVSALTLQRYEDGKTYFGKANELSTSMADCSYYYGVCCLATADYQTAIESFTASIEAGEALTLCYYNRGICYLQDADTYSLALADFGEVVSRGDDAELTESAELLIDQLTQALGEG